MYCHKTPGCPLKFSLVFVLVIPCQDLLNLTKITCSLSEKVCRDLIAPANGTVDMTSGVYEDMATFRCYHCYEFEKNGPSTVELFCGPDGKWNGSEPTCQGMLKPSRAHLSHEISMLPVYRKCICKNYNTTRCYIKVTN